MNEEAIRREDHALESKSEKAGEELARHRWHWTLDESNPERMSIRGYADLVGRSFATVKAHANGYAAHSSEHDTVLTRTLTDHIEAAKMGAEREAATQAIADARGTNFANVAANQRDEVTSTLGVARERAERLGTPVQEQIVSVAQHREKARQAERIERQDRAKMHTAEFLRIEAELGKAARSLRSAFEMGEERLSQEERDLLMVTLGNVRSLLGLIEMRFTGAADVDWDAELARLGGAS